jgi:hypothetical protein
MLKPGLALTVRIPEARPIVRIRMLLLMLGLLLAWVGPFLSHVYVHVVAGQLDGAGEV